MYHQLNWFTVGIFLASLFAVVAEGTPPLGTNGLPVAEGVVRWFDLKAGSGTIASTDGKEIFFNFTAIPGEGYRTLQPGTPVKFEVVAGKFGLTARNVQRSYSN